MYHTVSRLLYLARHCQPRRLYLVVHDTYALVLRSRALLDDTPTHPVVSCAATSSTPRRHGVAGHTMLSAPPFKVHAQLWCISLIACSMGAQRFPRGIVFTRIEVEESVYQVVLPRSLAMRI
jgi:hypothetical protein